MPAFRALTLALAAVLLALPSAAQDAPASGPLRLTVDDAVEIAVERAYAVRVAALDVETARAQVREAYGSLYPRVDATSQYTRNVVQANPFAGSSAGNIFGGLGALGWLQYNETARTDDDPATVPISFAEYNRRTDAGYAAIGYNPADASNPFGTDNQFTNALSISQPIYSGVAFAAVRGARSLVAIQEAAQAQREQDAAHEARTAFYQALLADEAAAVQRASAQRAADTERDVARVVAAGLRPVLDRLNADVDLANARTGVATAEARAASARDALALALGLPVGTPIEPVGTLDPSDAVLTRPLADAAAIDLRPDVQQALLAVRLGEVQRDITRAARLPTLSAFANLSYSGNVPDDRSFVVPTGNEVIDPVSGEPYFESTTGRNRLFSDAYWQPAVSVGLRLNWTLFDGFQTRARVQQNTAAIDQARIRLEQARNGAALEIASARRELDSARRRLDVQRQTVATAETAYTFAEARLTEGVATQADVRIASQNLDLARLNLLQAVYDALVARSAFERATSTLPDPDGAAAVRSASR